MVSEKLYLPIESKRTSQLEISNYSLAANSTYEITKTNLDTWSAILCIVKVTYNNSATAGIRVRWLYSADGTNFDSIEEAEAQGNYYDLTFTAGATRQTSILLPIFAPFVKIQIVNKDATYAQTLNNVWTILLR